MIKSLLLTLSCVISSGTGALQKNAPAFNNEPPQKNLIDRTTENNYDYFYIDPLRATHNTNDINKQKQFTTDTLKVNNNFRVAKTSQNTSINGYTIKSTLVSSAYLTTDNRTLVSQSTLIIGFRRKGIAQEVHFQTHNSDIPIYIPYIPPINTNNEEIDTECRIYNYNGLANDNIFNGLNYTQTDFWLYIYEGQLDNNVNYRTLRTIYSLDSNQQYNQSINYTYEEWGSYEATNQDTSLVYQQTENTGALQKKVANPPRLTYSGENNVWQTYIFRYVTKAYYQQGHIFADTDLKEKYVPMIQNTVLKIDQIVPQGTTINYETVEIAPLFWQVLTMPFTFISTAFNFTLFEGTAYEINPATILLALISALVIAWILKKLISRS